MTFPGTVVLHSKAPPPGKRIVAMPAVSGITWLVKYTESEPELKNTSSATPSGVTLAVYSYSASVTVVSPPSPVPVEMNVTRPALASHVIATLYLGAEVLDGTDIAQTSGSVIACATAAEMPASAAARD